MRVFNVVLLKVEIGGRKTLPTAINTQKGNNHIYLNIPQYERKKVYCKVLKNPHNNKY